MKNCLFAATVFLWILSAQAHAQKIWGDATLGMSPEQVTNAYPDATSVNGRSGPVDGLLQMKFVALGEVPSMVHFFFREQRLYRADWELKPGRTYDATMPTYEELLRGLKSEHPPKTVTATQRPFSMSDADRTKTATWFVERMDRQARGAKDEWDTVAGTRVSIHMLEAMRGDSVGITVSTNGGRRLEAESSQAKHQAQLAKIIAEKNIDERRHGEFLDRFVGKKINALAAALGAPTGTTKMPGGEVIYVWETQAGEGLSCRTSVFTKNTGLVYSWQWSGNTCRRK